MKYKIFLAQSILLVFLAGCDTAVEQATNTQSTASSETATAPATPTVPETPSSNVDETKKDETKEAKGAVTEFLIDVRSDGEWDEGHLDPAIHIPHTDIVEGIKKVTKDKDAKICLYWRAGGRAGTAQKALEAEGFTNVVNLGGVEDAKEYLESAEKDQ